MRELAQCAGAAGAPDWIFFSVIDWHFRHQRPQQLALALARSGRRVFYISVHFVDASGAGFGFERLHPELPLFQVLLRLTGAPSIYESSPDDKAQAQLRGGLLALWEQARIHEAVHLVQHPYWWGLAAGVPAARVVYDCMDYHVGFANTAASHEQAEAQLFTRSDLTVVTSDFLARHAREMGAQRVAVVRNGADFEHFHRASEQPTQAADVTDRLPSRPVLGYYGAIAEWFDTDLIERLARELPHCDIVLVGADTCGAAQHLAKCRNVVFKGERPYEELPKWLQAFDVCLIPFRISDLTLATNPVKAYEYLSAGKPVVGTDLPELAQFGDLLYRARDGADFLDKVSICLEEARSWRSRSAGMESIRQRCQRRIELARGQTWDHRAHDLLHETEIACREAVTSAVVVAYNQWPLTARCLASLADHDDGTLEVIVIDNASRDETPERLRQWQAQAPGRRQVVLNADNRGFGPAVNQGLAMASGEYLAVLNNDTVVCPGWARGLRRHLRADPGLGLLCPVTNNIGNEAQVALPGNSPQEVFASARRYCFGRGGRLLGLDTAAFFCVMMPRRVYEAVGPLDEQFVPGFFEDDDYCLRVRAAGWRIACAEDVFVYHELSASFDAEGASRRAAIFDRNKALFERKWGTWKPHVYRQESLRTP